MGRVVGCCCQEQPACPAIDGLFAATALHHDLMFVTRNDGDVSWIFLSYANRSCTTQAELTLGFVGG